MRPARRASTHRQADEAYGRSLASGSAAVRKECANRRSHTCCRDPMERCRAARVPSVQECPGVVRRRAAVCGPGGSESGGSGHTARTRHRRTRPWSPRAGTLVSSPRSPVAFGRRCIPGRRVARRLNTHCIRPPRALRAAALGVNRTSRTRHYRTTNSIRGKSNLPATASMMLIWHVYKPGVNDDAGTSN